MYVLKFKYLITSVLFICNSIKNWSTFNDNSSIVVTVTQLVFSTKQIEKPKLTKVGFLYVIFFSIKRLAFLN